MAFLLSGDSEGVICDGNLPECLLGLIQTFRPFRDTNREAVPCFQGAGDSLGIFVAGKQLEKLGPQGVFCEGWWKTQCGQVLQLFPNAGAHRGKSILLRGCDERGQTHKMQRKAEAAADPMLPYCCSGSPLTPNKSQSKRVGLLLLPAYQSPHSPLGHTLRAESIPTTAPLCFN